ncbi:MAG: sulfatase family protein [Tepidiformaceae bacterium]
MSPRALPKLVVFALVAVILSACGGESTSPGPAASADATTAAPAAPGSASGASPSPVATRPNIVLLLLDDHDAAAFEHMPNVRDLVAARGVTLPNFFITLPLCCPSRASILRGQYAHNTGIWRNAPPDGGFETFYEQKLHESTVATWLDAAGYRTALYGKFMNGYPETAPANFMPPGWDEWGAVAGDMGYYNYILNDNGSLVDYDNAPEDYLTDVIAGKADRFVRESAASGEPFFLYLPVYAPHGPATAAPRHASLFEDATAPRNPNFDEADVSDKPRFLRDSPPLTAAQITEIDADYRARLRSLQAVDELLAGVVGALTETGELESTYIFVTSDNGWHQGEHRIEKGKQSPYEESVRVSMMVSGPGIAPGSHADGLAANIDLAPTFAALGGAEVPAFVDGRSLVPLLRGHSLASWRTAILFERARRKNENRDATRTPGFVAVRTARHVYIEYSSGETELYDLQADPFQLQNLIPRGDLALIAGLKTSLAELEHCQAGACRAADGGALTIP